MNSSCEKELFAICNICGHAGSFLVKDLAAGVWLGLSRGSANLRESLTCRKCGSISRDRMLIWALGSRLNEKGPLCSWKTNKSIRILEATGVRAHPVHLGKKFDYYNTKYDQRKLRSRLFPRRFADFEDLHYADSHFEFVLASDVFEHIRNDERAFREVLRVLKPEGCLLLQVPIAHSRNTEIQVRVVEDKDIFLTPPEYHGGRTLVYRAYGMDLLDNLERIGFTVDNLEAEVTEHAINRQSIVIARKAGVGKRARNYDAGCSGTETSVSHLVWYTDQED